MKKNKDMISKKDYINLKRYNLFNMKGYEEFCNKCSYYKNNECFAIIEGMTEMLKMDMMHISYSEKEIAEKYACPYKAEILMKNFNNENRRK